MKPATQSGVEQEEQHEEKDNKVSNATAGLDVPLVVEDVCHGREIVCDLPDDVRQPDDEHQRCPDPGISRPQVRAERGSHECGDTHAEDQGKDQILHLEADAERQAKQDPGVRFTVDDDREKQVQREHPRQLIEHDGLEEPRTEQERRGQSDEQRERLESQRSAELAHIGSTNQDVDRTNQRGQHPKRPRRHAEHRGLEPGQERHDGRVVDIAECEMPAALHVVELVDVESERAVGRKADGDEDGRRDGVDERCQVTRARAHCSVTRGDRLPFTRRFVDNHSERHTHTDCGLSSR